MAEAVPKLTASHSLSEYALAQRVAVLPSNALAASNPALVVSCDEAVADLPSDKLTTAAHTAFDEPLDELVLEELELLVEEVDDVEVDEPLELDVEVPGAPPQAFRVIAIAVVKKIRLQ